MVKQKTKLTITIPTFNESQDLPICLSAIANQTLSKQIEVIIVDNYSTDDSIKIAKSFSKKLNIKIIMNKIKDAEVSKLLGFQNSDSEYFMYLDADMTFSSPDFVEKMLLPLETDKTISSVLCQFIVNRSHSPLTRALSYDEFQRDPIFKYFTISVSDIVSKKNKDYWLLEADKHSVPPQSLMIYRKSLIQEYAKTQKQLIDNEIPAVLVDQGHTKFAFVPSAGVYHFLLRSLSELWRKRVRNLERTYYPNISERKYKWINWKKDFP
ncbi:hypothetical protein CMI45_00005, partial [Candidatus Pacearchaeota archaeon]|nr:hypothetical protein [Candidatus Pacearchaeota archaeon]